MTNYTIIVAGGRGTRMGNEVPKQFLLLNGKPVLMHTIEAFFAYNPKMKIIVVLPPDEFDRWNSLVAEHQFNIPHQLTEGGVTRFESVKNALEKITSPGLVAVHDGARPLVSQEIIENTFEMARVQRAAYPVLPVTDTLRKRSTSVKYAKLVDRSLYFLAQTPQVFYSDLLLDAYKQQNSSSFTDDVSVVEANGLIIPARTEGSLENIKITTPFDLLLAETIIKCRT